MSQSAEIDALVDAVVHTYAEFDIRLGKRAFPKSEFKALFEAVVRYSKATADDPKIHRVVVNLICGLREYLEVSSLRVPGKAIADADRMYSILVNGHDPHFEGDEPPCC